MFEKLKILIIGLALCFVCAGCSVNPVTGETQFNIFGNIKNDTTLGLQWAPQIEKEMGGVLEIPAITDYVNTVGQRIASGSHAPSLQWQFKVLNNDTVNAFALPGGHVYITSGMLKKLETEAQLAGVLSHESAHITLRHSSVRMSEQIGLDILLSAVMPEDSSAGLIRATSIARQIVTLKYSRDDERQSDKIGMWYMVKAGYDPYGMVQTMQMLESENSARPIEFLSSHPSPGNRVWNLTANINNNYSNLTDTKIGKEDYQEIVLERLNK